jgi:hypothetical protein
MGTKSVPMSGFFGLGLPPYFGGINRGLYQGKKIIKRFIQTYYFEKVYVDIDSS